MKKEVTLREVRILFDAKTDKRIQMGLKICVDQKIMKLKDFRQQSTCHRWDSTQQLRLSIREQSVIEMEIYDKRLAKKGGVLGETSIDLSRMSSRGLGQLKNCIKMDGVVVGWLYCELLFQGIPRQNVVGEQYLNIHKVDLHFLRSTSTVSISIFLNTLSLYHKQVNMHTTSRVLYPNIKIKIKRSDVIIFRIQTQKCEIMPISFIADQIQSGQPSQIKIWMRNQLTNKVGDLSFEYFLDSLYFQSENVSFQSENISKNQEKSRDRTLTAQSGNYLSSIKEKQNLSKKISKVEEKEIKKFILSFSNFNFQPKIKGIQEREEKPLRPSSDWNVAFFPRIH